MAKVFLSTRLTAAGLGLTSCIATGIFGAGSVLADEDASAEPQSSNAPVPVAIPRPVEAPAQLTGAGAKLPTPEELEKLHAIVGHVSIDVDDIFDTEDPREDKLLYRWANDLHIRTREGTVREQLLIKQGEPYSAQKSEETARNLRQRSYLSEAEVIPTGYDPDTNVVDLKVRVRDVWTLEPGIGFGRSGGENKSRIRLADQNFLGFGQTLVLEYKSNVDRSGIGVEFTDPNVFSSWWGVQGHYANNSDGWVYSGAVAHPFFSLDSRWSAGLGAQSIQQDTSIYDRGEVLTRIASRYETVSVQGGTSKGLVNGWTSRWLAGFRYDKARFEPAVDEPFIFLPEDRTLSYPWVGVELIQNSYVTTSNQDQIGRTEDVFLGNRLQASLGWSTPAFGADGSAGIYSIAANFGRPLFRRDILQFNGTWSGRYESGGTVDSLVDGSARWYHRFNEHNVMVAELGGAHAHALDLDQQLQLGGDNGLRGYPLRYQTGDTRVLATLEERFYSNWFPWRLFRVGAAAFVDAGRMWGDAPFTSEPLGWLYDAGFGLRIGNARSGIGSVLHIDLAFPLNAPSDVDTMQVLIEAEKSF